MGQIGLRWLRREATPEMIDRKARDELADLLARYIRGEASDGDIEEFVVPLETDDRGLLAVAYFNTALPRDTSGAPMFGNPKVQRKIRMIERAILFLRTDMEYRWERVRLPLWTLALAPVVLAVLVLMIFAAFVAAEPIASFIARIGISIDPVDVFLLGSVALPIAAILLIERLLGVSGGYWPFYHRRDYLEALSKQSNEGDSARDA